MAEVGIDLRVLARALADVEVKVDRLAAKCGRSERDNQTIVVEAKWGGQLRMASGPLRAPLHKRQIS